MKKGIVWGLGLFLAAAVPVIALAVAPPGASAAAGAVQVQTALDSTGVAAQETNLGDVIADAVRATGSADVALVAADEVTETTIPAGSVPPAHIVKSLRYADDPTDTVVVLKLTGAQIRSALERSVSRAPQPFDGFFQVSGLQVHYDPSKAEGSRVTRITVGGSPLQNAQTYQVATTRAVADGSFGYFSLWSKSDIAEDTHTTIADALANYLSAHRTINAAVENRITP